MAKTNVVSMSMHPVLLEAFDRNLHGHNRSVVIQAAIRSYLESNEQEQIIQAFYREKQEWDKQLKRESK